jgi:hypothetical protein
MAPLLLLLALLMAPLLPLLLPLLLPPQDRTWQLSHQVLLLLLLLTGLNAAAPQQHPLHPQQHLN